MLPESNYSLCVKTRAVNGELLTETCVDFEISIPNPPELIFPEDEGAIDLGQPTFMWNPINIPHDVDVYYNFKLVQILEGQTKYRAIQSNIPILETEIVNSNLYSYKLDDYQLEENASYAWQVQAVNDEGMPLSTNNGYSDIFSFTYGNKNSELNIDTLEVIENVAYLIDINQLSVVKNEAFYTLNGIATLLFIKSDESKVQLEVSVQNLMVQQFGDDNPILLGGNINGDLVDDIFPSSITGTYFNPRSFDLQIPYQFMINGVFNIGDQTEIPLSGNLLYEHGVLSGELMATAQDGISLLSFGSEIVRYNISSAQLKFPSLEIDFTGSFSFFDGMPMAMSDEFTMSSNGDFAFNFSSEIPFEVSLSSTSDFLKLVINSYQGSVSGNIYTQKYNFNVLTDSKIEFNANPDNSFGADLELLLSPNSMKVISFYPSEDFENNYIDLGWLKFKMERMNLNALSYANSEWDFDFSLDAKFNLPNFSEMDFPTIHGVTFTPTGLKFPQIDFDNFSIPNIDFAGFALEIYGLRMQPFTFDLSTWTPGSIANFSFDFDSYLTFPNFPEGSAAEFFGDGINISPNITGGKFNFEIPTINFTNPLTLSMLDNFKFNVNEISGSLGSDFDGVNFSFLPNIKLKGDLVLPPAFGCEDGEETVISINNGITVSGDGKLSGEITNIVPECPIKFGMVSLFFSNSKLQFTNEENQKIILEGNAGIKFSNAMETDPIGNLSAKYDIMNNDLIYLNGSINDKFRWNIGGENPLLSFMINSANINNRILEIDGRNSVVFGSTEFGVTFDQFQINLSDLKIESGSIFFDSGFNLKLTGIEDNNFVITTEPFGTKLNGEAGLMLSLPDQISISKDGIKVIGDGTAEINFNGKNYSGIGVKFSSDFAFNMQDFSVKNGMIEFFSNGNRLAYWDESGFVPDINFFLNYIIPEKLPLPTLDLAYLQLKSNDSLLVNVVPNGDEVTISTFEGKPIPLVFKGLQFNEPLPPQIDVTFSLTVNTNSEAVTGGQIFVNIPEEFRDDFDLSKLGIPYQIHSIFYGEIEGNYGFKLVGKAKLFETELNCSDSLSLTITNAGNLIGSVDCPLETTIPMVPESNKLNLVMNRITGEFNVDLLSRTIDYDFALDSDIRFQLDESSTWGVWTLLGVTPDGIEFRDSRVDSVAIPKISLPNFDISMSNISLPNLSFTNGVNGSSGTWNFEFGMDVDMSFPQLGFSIKIPSADGMSLTRSGFHFPNISISDLPDSLSFDLSGFVIHPTGFRFPQIDFNWFDPLSSEIDWNFDFDLNVDLPKVVGDIRTLSFSDVHFNEGMFSGEFPTINFGLGELILPMGNGLDFNITGITTNFFNNEGLQGLNFGFKGQLKMPEFATCENSNGTLYDISQTELTFGSNGFLSGRIENFAPTCPINLGFGKFNITSSSLEFAANDSSQSAVIDMQGAIKIATGGQDTVTANGSLVMNLINGELIDGEVQINEQFVLNLPKENPVLRFIVNSAVYNKNGLAINGNSQILLEGGNTLPVNFQEFMFDPIQFKVLSGSITIADSLSLLLKVGEDRIDYSLVPYNFILNENQTAKVGLKGGVTIDANGISANGEALASINWSEEFNFDGLRADFSDDFKMRIAPFGVEEGKVDIFRNENKIATYDNSGLHLGDIFGIIPLPERIPLPSEEIAYLQIKNGETVLVQTESVPNGTRISTRAGESVKLKIPGLKYGSENAPEYNVQFSVVINPSDRQIVEGEITIDATEDNPSLLNLRSKGIPVDIKQIRYGKNSSNVYQLTSQVKFELPSMLANFPVDIENLEINQDGLAGTINLGQYFDHYPENEIPTLASSLVGENALITLEGVNASFGANKAFKFSGKFIPKMFIDNGDTSKIHYSAEWISAQNKFSFGLDLAEGQDINLGIAQFVPTAFGEQPAMKLEFTESPTSDFAFILNGQILFDSFGEANEFSLDFRNMQITKNNFSVDDLSLPNIENALQFELFKSRFQIYDVNLNGVNHHGISFSYNDGVFKVELAGKLTFFDKEIMFAGLGIDTHGNFTMPNVDFITAPLVVVDNFLTLTKVRLNNNKLDIGGSAKLPKPAADDNHFDFNFSINPDGTFEGLSGNEFVLIDETRSGLGGGDASEYKFWIGNFDARYLSLTLDFEHMQQSTIQIVADVYFNDDAIGIGNRGVGTITPGLTVDFTGRTEFGPVSIPGSLGNVNWEMLQIHIEQVNLNNENGFEFELTGNFSLGISGVEGGLNFGGTDRGGLIITSTGGIENFGNSISGGNFSILDVVTVTVQNVGFSSTPTDIIITANTSSGNSVGTENRTIRVNNYFSFGGSVDIAGFMSGGIDRLLTYSTDNGFALLIENANLEIENVISMRMDLIYESIGGSYKILAGATGNLDMGGYEVIVVGKVATGSFGFFVAVDGLQIPLGPVVLAGVGGGFFYNPTTQDVNLVKSLCGLGNSSASSKIKIPDNASFAVFLYASLAFAEDDIIQGRVLLSLVGTSYFSLDGDLVFLSQDGRLYGTVSLQADFDHGYLDGNIQVFMKVPHLIDGNGTLAFYIYGRDTWAVMGNSHATVVSFFDVDNRLFIGPSGFLLGMEAHAGFDVWIIEVDAGFEAQIWYIENVSWGAYATAYVKAALWANIASAKGWLKCALFGEPNFYIYGEAGVSVSVLCFSGSASVWAKISAAGVDGGKGHDSEMSRLIDEAQGTCEEAQAQADAIQGAVNNQPPPSFTLSDEELAQAYANLSEWARKYKYGTQTERTEAWQFFLSIREVETNIPGIPVFTNIGGEFELYNLVLNEIYLGERAPSQNDYSTALSSLDSALTAYSEVRNEFMANVDPSLIALETISNDFDTVSNMPINMAGLSEPQFEEYIDANGQTRTRIVAGTQPSFSVDAELDSQNKQAITETVASAEAFEEQVMAQIANLDQNIQKIETILVGANGNGGAEKLASSYGSMMTSISNIYTNKFIQDKKMYNWAHNYRGIMASQNTNIVTVMRVKSYMVYNRGWTYLRDLTANRVRKLASLAGNDGDAEANTVISSWNDYHSRVSEDVFKDWALGEATSKGVMLWSTLPKEGLNAVKQSSMDLVNNDVNDKKNVINTLREFQTSFSNQIQDLYTSLATLYEKKADILNLLIYDRQTRNLSTTDLVNQKTAITRKMVLPNISFFQASTVDQGMYAKAVIIWRATGNDGPNKYLVDYVEHSPYNPLKGFASIGNVGWLQLNYLPEMGRTSFGPTTFYVKARNPIGYTIERNLTFTPTFSNTDNVIFNNIDIISEEQDLTPPIVYSDINFPEGFISQNIEGQTGYKKYYTGNPNLVSASWEAYDGESGIREYLYKFVEVENPDNLSGGMNQTPIHVTPNGTNFNFTPEFIPGTTYFMPCAVENIISTLIPQTTNNGRSNVNLNTVNLSNNSAYQLIVSAVNGDGLSSSNCGGLKQILIVDTTPPSQPGRIQYPIQHFPPFVLPGYTVINTVEELPSIKDGYRFNRLIYTGPRNTSEAEFPIEWNNASDDESHILNYEYKVTNKNNPSVTTEWLNAGVVESLIGRIPKRSVTLRNNIPGLEILNYVDSFYVDIRAKNYAQLSGESIRYNFKIFDDTAPTNPSVAFAYSPDGTRPVLLFKTHSLDPESGIDHYEVAVSSQPNNVFDYLPWELAIRINPSDIMQNGSFTLRGVPENTKSYIAVRAVNKQGRKSRYCYTGPYYQDNTKPLTPGVSLDKFSINGRITLSMTFSNVRDLESEISKVEYRVLKKTVGSTKWSEVQNWTESPTLTSAALDLSRFNVNASDRIKVYVKSTNSVGLVSNSGEREILLDTTPPVTPTISLFISGILQNKTINMSFGNISDPQTGIDRIEYKVYKQRATAYLGYIELSDWISNGTNVNSSFAYRLYNLEPGNRIKIKVRTINRNGLISETAEVEKTLN